MVRTGRTDDGQIDKVENIGRGKKAKHTNIASSCNSNNIGIYPKQIFVYIFYYGVTSFEH